MEYMSNSLFTRILLLPFLLLSGGFVSCSPGPEEKAVIKLAAQGIFEGSYQRELHQAATRGDMDMIKLLVHAGTNVNYCDEQGLSVLHTAILSGHASEARFLMKAGARANTLSAAGDSPLIDAFNHQGQKLIMPLIEAGADVAQLSPHNQESILWLAAQQNLEELVRELINVEGLPLNQVNRAGLSPLFVAIRNNNEAIMGMLLAAGADVSLGDATGFTPLMHAIKEQNTNLALRLIQAGAALDATDNTGQTALALALAKANKRVARTLVQAGARTEGYDLSLLND